MQELRRISIFGPFLAYQHGRSTVLLQRAYLYSSFRDTYNLPPVRIFIFILALLASSITLQAQQGWETGAALGVGHYFGDLNTDLSLTDPGVAFGALARYNFSNRWSTRLFLGYTKVSAYDNDSRNIYEQARNLHFRSNVIDGSLGLEFNFLQYDHGSRDHFFTPYVFGSFMVSQFAPQAELDDVWVDLRDFGTEGQFTGDEYYTTTLGLSYGLGVKLDLNYEWSINFEVNARQLFSDYLDDVSTVYPDMEDLGDLRGDDAVRLSDRSILIQGVNDAQIGEEGRFRGNSSDNDQYAAITFAIVYYFGDLKCPEYGSR